MNFIHNNNRMQLAEKQLKQLHKDHGEGIETTERDVEVEMIFLCVLCVFSVISV